MKNEKIKCKDCEFLKAYGSNHGGIRCLFYCAHKNKSYIRSYYKSHNIRKEPGFICFGSGLYGDEPTIKTKPAWCPLNKKKENKENDKT